MMNFDNMNVWCGSQASHDQAMHFLMQGYNSPEIMLLLNKQQSDNRNDGPENPVKLDMHGNIAILTVEGPMISNSSLMSRYFGVVSYDDITERLYDLGDAPGEAKAVLINYNSSGGAAIGMGGTSKTIRAFSDGVMPVFSYTDRQAASAAYWLYAAGAKAYVGEDAQLGSIGAIVFHSEFSKARAAAGITDTVIRSNAGKCLVNPIEPLTDKAKANLQAEADKWQDLFVAGIADLRDLPEKTVSSTIANGNMYDADEAVKLSMADGVLSFEQLIAKLSKGVK